MTIKDREGNVVGPPPTRPKIGTIYTTTIKKEKVKFTPAPDRRDGKVDKPIMTFRGRKL